MIEEVEERSSVAWGSIVIAAAVPTVVSIFALGQMMNEIQQIGGQLADELFDQSRLESRWSSAEAKIARLDAEIEPASAEVARRASRLEQLESTAARTEVRLQVFCGSKPALSGTARAGLGG
jgi:hypothetical protein